MPGVPAGRAAGARRAPGVTPSTSCGVKLQRDHDGDPDLVERARHGAQQPARVGQRVGGAHAGQHGGQLQPGVHRAEHALDRHLAAEPHAGRPVRQRHLRQVNSTWPGTGAPKSAAKTTRIATTTRPIRR